MLWRTAQTFRSRLQFSKDRLHSINVAGLFPSISSTSYNTCPRIVLNEQKQPEP